LKLQLTSSEFSKIIDSKQFGTIQEHTIQSIAYDTRKILNASNCVFFALKGEFRDGHVYIKNAYDLGIHTFVISDKKFIENNIKNFPEAQFYLVKDVLEALQKLAKNHRQKFSLPVIGITGSVGKTVVKEWLYHLLKTKYKIVRSPKSYNSQLGVALSILEVDNEHSLALFEAGISKAGEMSFLEEMIQPNIGIFTAFGSAHAQNFSSKTEHLLEKEKLFIHCKKTFVSETISTNSINNCEIVEKNNFLTYLQHSPFQDQASLQNLSLALAVALEFGAEKEELIQQIKTLPRLAMRMETFDGINGNIIINDAYNVDLDALNQSLEYQQSIAKNKLRTAIIGIDGLDEEQIQKIKSKLKHFNLYQCFFITQNEIPPIEKIQQQIVLIKGTRVGQIQRIANLFQLKKHKTRVEIDLSAVKKNLSFFRNSIHKNCKILVMVKASSYGSGAEKMAEYLEKNGVEYLGVAYIDEGIELRKHGVTLPILVMNPDEDGFNDLIKFNLEPSIYSFDMLENFVKALINNSSENYPIHLKFDTGMHRLGFEMEEKQSLLEYIQAQPEVKIQSIYSHLADSDNYESKTYTLEQIKNFNKIVSYFSEKLSYNFMKHLLNSEAITRFPEAQFDMVRIGIGLYGISSNPDLKRELFSAISWTSIISQIKTIHKDESVGYGRKFTAEKETKIATIPVGYADGFKRNLSLGKGGMFVSGKFCPVVGNVCMDMTMIDVSEITCEIGDKVEIIGEHQKIEHLAEAMQTIPYEVLTSLSKRLQRVYVEE
jgi:Alr-MurF fusion protein